MTITQCEQAILRVKAASGYSKLDEHLSGGSEQRSSPRCKRFWKRA